MSFRVMSTLFAVVAAALALLSGCGNGDHMSTEQRPASRVASLLAERVSAWGDAATSYNAILQHCASQPNPVRGFTAACTREWRRKYERAAARLREVSLGVNAATRDCGRAFAKATSLIPGVTGALRQAVQANDELLRAVDEDRTYHGPRVFPVLNRANSVTRRDAKLAGSLSNTIRESCAGS
jgi:hypothetical protein